MIKRAKRTIYEAWLWRRKEKNGNNFTFLLYFATFFASFLLFFILARTQYFFAATIHKAVYRKSEKQKANK